MKYKTATQQLPAFILFGIALALIAGLFIIFAYVVLWGVVIGSISWGIYWIKNYFSRKSSSKKGRIIDYDQYKS